MDFSMPVKPATWKLPEGHEAMAAFATVEEAQDCARGLYGTLGGMNWRYYVMDKRGAWEVIRHR